MAGLGAIAIAKLFDLALEHGKPLAVDQLKAQVRRAIEDRQDNVAKQDAAQWGAGQQGDPKNDFPGDLLSRRLDNALFLYGKALPGKATDFIRDALSPAITPGLRAQVDENVTSERVAELVGAALVAEAERVIDATAVQVP
jgi:hypothetical protein